MAVRLNVIMVHSPPASANASQLSEAVVGEIIGRPGIDMTLIGRLDRMSPNSTDRLTLDSITGDAAVLDWRSPQDLMKTLQSIGFDGVRAVHSADRDGTPLPNGRKIYAFDLTRFSDPADVCQSLMKLLSDRQVRTFTLGKMSDPQPSVPSDGPFDTSAQEASCHQNSVEKIPPATRREPRSDIDHDHPAKTSQSIDLDDLVDQLDALDP